MIGKRCLRGAEDWGPARGGSGRVEDGREASGGAAGKLLQPGEGGGDVGGGGGQGGAVGRLLKPGGGGGAVGEGGGAGGWGWSVDDDPRQSQGGGGGQLGRRHRPAAVLGHQNRDRKPSHQGGFALDRVRS